MLKRSISILLTCLLLFTTASAFTPTDVVGTSSEKAVRLLTNLGIIKSYEDDTFRPNDAVTRAEVSTVLAKFVAYNDESVLLSPQHHFVDVEQNHWAYADINLLAAVGIVSPSADYHFYPDKNISFPELFKMIVCVLGYDQQALASGGYPAGYNKIAAGLGLATGVTSADQLVKRGDFAIVMNNAIDADIMKRVGYGTTATYEIQKGVTLLTEHLNVYKLKNQVIEATDITSVSGNKALKGEVIIGGEIYKVGKVNVNKMLGQSVNLYYKLDNEKNEKVLVYVETVKSNKVVEISDKLLINAGPKSIEYYLDDNFTKSEKIPLSDDFTMIYNGKRYSRYTGEDFNPSFGSLTAIDNNGDGNFDVLFVTSYQNIVVDTISTSEYVIADKYGNLNIDVNPNNKDLSISYIYSDGSEYSLDSLSEGDVLSVAMSKSDDETAAITIMVSSEVVDGKVSEVSEDQVTIGDIVYTISPCFDEVMGDDFRFTVNTNGTFFVDFAGNVTAVDLQSTGEGLSYGYLINAQAKGGLEKTATLKVFTSAGEVAFYEFAKRVTINSKAEENKGDNMIGFFLDRMTGNVLPQLIKYELNADKKIVKLYTAQVSDNGDENALTLDATVTLGGEGSKFSYSSNIFGYKYAFDELTVIFNVPKSSPEWYDENLYEIRKLSSFAGDDEYAYKAYDLNDVNWVGAAVFEAAKNESKFTKNTPAMVVDHIVSTLNADGDQVYKVYGYTQGVLGEFILKDTVIYKYGTSSSALATVSVKDLKIKSGDYIRYVANNKKEIISLQKSFSAGSADSLFTVNDTKIKPHVSFETGENSDGLYQVYFGTVERKEGMLTKLIVKTLSSNGTYSEAERVFNMGRGKFYSYNMKTNKLTLANAGEILDARAGDHKSRLFIRTRGTEIYDTLIITGMDEPSGWAD